MDFALPPWLQSGVRSIGFQYVMLLFLLHRLLAAPACWAAFNSCANFDLSFLFFLALAFVLWPVQETHSSSWDCLSLAYACHMLTYPEIHFSWFLWYIQRHNPHMVTTSLCIPMGVYFLLFKGLSQRLSLVELTVCLVHLIILPS